MTDEQVHETNLRMSAGPDMRHVAYLRALIPLALASSEMTVGCQ